MNPNINDWDEDLPPEPQEVYQDLIRALQRKDGFGLFFVQCSSPEAEGIIAKIPHDIPQKNVEVLRLVEAVDNLYSRVAEFTKNKQVDILLITGLEYSLYKYEKRKFGEISEGHFGNLSSVPPILNHLNQQRERFRDDFPLCFVFLLRSFSINYLINRAPDFFDWRSGVFELPNTPEFVAQESSRLLLEGDYEEYLQLTPEQKIERILEFQELLDDKTLTNNNRANLLFKLGNLLVATHEYQAAITSYDEAVKLKQNYYQAWYNRGLALRHLEQYEEAIKSFQQAVKIKPNFHSAWNNQGAILSDNLQQYEAAIAAYKKAVRIAPKLHESWFNLGIAFLNYKLYREAVNNLDKAIEIKPNDYKAWYARGEALYGLELHQDAIASQNKALNLSITELDEANILIDKELESLIYSFVGYEEYNIVPSTAAKLAQDWRSRLYFDCPEYSDSIRESIVDWLLGIDLEHFNQLNAQDLEKTKQAMEYRYKILRQRYLGVSRDNAYRNLISRLGSLVILRNKIQTWLAQNSKLKHTIIDVLQEVIQELLQRDKYIQQQMVVIAKCTNDKRLKNALLFATIEEYSLRPIRNQPLLIYRLIDYIHRSQGQGMTQIPKNNQAEIIYEEIIAEESRDKYNSLNQKAVTNYTDKQKQEEEHFLQNARKQEFENYLLNNLGQEALNWLKLYLQGKSQKQIAKELSKPIKEIYRMREKISYHARKFASMK